MISNVNKYTELNHTHLDSDIFKRSKNDLISNSDLDNNKNDNKSNKNNKKKKEKKKKKKEEKEKKKKKEKVTCSE